MKDINNISNNTENSLYNKILSSGLFNPEWYANTYHISEDNLSNANLDISIDNTDKSNTVQNIEAKISSDTENEVSSNTYENVSSPARANTKIDQGSSIGLLNHYMTEGWKQGFDPCSEFSTSCYLGDYQDIKDSGINPLEHYITYGMNEGRVKREHRDWPSFSIVMATYNRKDMVCNAIDSALKQVTDFEIKYELIITDDGSEDGTIDFLKNKYAKEIKKGLITLLPLKHSGVCATRNEAVKNAKYEWICYLDDDNILRPNFLDIFSKEIIRNTKAQFIYGQHYLSVEQKVTEHEFDRSQLLKGNYIDLGSICHTKKIFNRIGGFDINLTRLVDWDLIIRITGITTPVYIPKIVMEYSSSQEYKRISNTVTVGKNVEIIFSKNLSELEMHRKFESVTEEINKLNVLLQEHQEQHKLEINRLHQEQERMKQDIEKQFISIIPIVAAVTSRVTLLKFKILKSITFGESHQKYKRIYKGLKNIKQICRSNNL